MPITDEQILQGQIASMHAMQNIGKYHSIKISFAQVMDVPDDENNPEYQEALKKVRQPFSHETAEYASKIVRIDDGLTGGYYTSEPEPAA